MNRFQIIDGKKAKELAASGNFIVVDLREKKDYKEDHIENAISLPNATMNDIEIINEKNKPWILYCNRGSLSFRLASKMAKEGYDVMAVRGGIKF